MAKLEREALMHYLDASFKKAAETAEWAILGDDIEEMSVELNPDTEQNDGGGSLCKQPPLSAGKSQPGKSGSAVLTL